MNWEAISAVAEIMGSVAVIGTIFYLAIQVRHAAAVSKASTQQSAAQMSIDSMMPALDSRILSSASRKSTSGEELTPDELSNYTRWVWVRMRVVENAYFQYQQGLLESDAWCGYSGVIIAHLSVGAAAQPYWERISHAYSESFVAEVTRILEWASMHGDSAIIKNRTEFIAMLENR